MRKIKILCLFVITFFLFNTKCYASVNTYTRTNENLLVPNDVVVDSNNVNAIMNTPAVSSSEKIYDYADLFTPTEEKKLYDSIDEYIDNSNIDAAIVTTKDLRGFSISDYAYNFYDYNDFMSDGVIFVIYINTTEPEIFMGNSGDEEGKVFTIYTDSRINQTLEYVYKDISSGNYYTACDNYIKILKGFYNKDRGGNYRVDDDGNIVKSISWLEIIILSVASTFIIVFVLIYKVNKYKNNSFTVDLNSNLDSNTLVVKKNSDNLIDTHVSRGK